MLSDEELEELNRVWTVARIFSSTAHDVNNALQVISGSAELLEARGDLDPLTLRRIQAIRNQTARATEAIDRLLTYTRQPPGAIQAVDIAPIVTAAIAMRSFTLKRVSVMIESQMDREPYVAMVDPRAMLQALLTLLLYFEKTLAARAPARLTVALDRAADAIAIHVVAEASGAVEDAAAESNVWAGDPLGPGQLDALRALVARQRGALALEGKGPGLSRATIMLPGS
jgi:nitrogen fixation/metabolism regulation signal transduction histidine kinase